MYFQSLPRSPLIDAIEGATASPYSHCGILHWNGSGWEVLEAVQSVTSTPLAEWIARSRDGNYAVFRLTKEHQAKIGQFIRAARSYEGRPYDIRYDFDDDSIYCSELVYKAFRTATGEELGRVQTLGELDWRPYEGTIRQLESGTLPLDRRMITPRAVSEAIPLRRVFP